MISCVPRPPPSSRLCAHRVCTASFAALAPPPLLPLHLVCRGFLSRVSFSTAAAAAIPIPVDGCVHPLTHVCGDSCPHGRFEISREVPQLAMISRYVLTCVCMSTSHINTLLQEEYHCLTDIT
ncbi:hypothetical protein LMJF_28_2415 [Leishmania major strain Friedlin]|uniref:Uncharacterized protein n=1 Tax=Leishmania major TaxID=5664 RepID=E9ADK2_LEIMA|nr:hypothetical protein LMJF_28_2415 [Leishmania major strain Friedlin]CAG9577355.1 hypothetical_protein [Leishmania major strain Friedlin]CBZ05854.1 hypothetical protein LMJF_28_2415 [Leishmania major strain Friedlin]|eukprot:XP_003722074.1 hypothetical protein LMJF_28_2415 [Leishmania major strain Friedlin]